MRILSFITFIVVWLPALARDLTASLITCYPGSEIYELCGHSALRIRGEGIDSVWNYGIFNFNEPNFVYRFVKGETDYMVAGYPFRWFLPEYVSAGRRVVEQDLNLSPEETQKLLEALQKESLPENRTYRYNYIRDNCSTRIITRIDSASNQKVIYPDSTVYGTFREEMRAYHTNYPWYQFGIDIALGSELDAPINSREEMFVPVEFMNNMAKAHFSDGRPVVKETRILNEGSENAVLPPTSFWSGPLFLSWLISLIIVALCVYSMYSETLIKPVCFIWFLFLGLAGCLVAFLVFVSVHAATSPNVLIFWLNPLQLLFCIGICVKKLNPMAYIMALYNGVGITLLLIVWPFIQQSANPAFFPLMGATAMLGIFYAILNRKKSYNNNGLIPRNKIYKRGK